MGAISLIIALMGFHPATDVRIQHVGRHVVESDGIRFAASGYTIRFRARTGHLDILLRDEERGDNRNAFSVRADGVEVGRFQTRAGVTRYRVASGSGGEARLFEIIKDTEGQNGWSLLEGIEVDELLEPPTRASRRIEFIGDSITCGYGMDTDAFPCESSLWYEPTRASLSYAMRLGRRFEAETVLTAVSGMGMYRNWNSLSPVMPDRYDGVFADFMDGQPVWDHARFSPGLIVIALGTNDFSNGDGQTPRPAFDAGAYRDTYAAFVARLRALHPDAAFLLLASPTLDADRLATQLRLLRTIPGTSVAAFSAVYAAGCSGHPDLDEHIRMAADIEPAIRTLMNWP
jgi:lysophospholipase L1-like esterase